MPEFTITDHVVDRYIERIHSLRSPWEEPDRKTIREEIRLLLATADPRSAISTMRNRGDVANEESNCGTSSLFPRKQAGCRVTTASVRQPNI